MKKKILFLIPALILLLLHTAVAAKGAAGRKLTLMVYMCGSNLESTGGSASTDIHEMMDAVQPDDNITILVMTGGTNNVVPSPYFRNNLIQILEIAPGKVRVVEQSKESLSMASADTLKWFLDFGSTFYPAQEYALIIWDHGGGPLGGICWDENYSMDSMSMETVQDALRRSAVKLDWIGFDACLMSSVEVAAAVAPYARYMIASQESEPASGWDYSFLRHIGRDRDGAETGRRIIDAYFASLADSKDVLTLSCVDLDKIAPLADRMNSCFAGAAELLDNESFNRFSVMRMDTVSFGKAQRDFLLYGYDLVDLGSLVRHYGDRNPELLQALEEAVVYNRSNTGNTCGLSVYHPYINKEQYRSAWRREYRGLHFCEGYTLYTEKFAALLLEEPKTDWSGLETADCGADENGTHHFTLQLTPEQQADFASAQFLILRAGAFSSGNATTLYPVYSGKASVNADGLVTAGYGNELLYAVNSENEHLFGPVCFMSDSSEDEIRIVVKYVDDSGGAVTKPNTNVLYICNYQEGQTGDLEIRHRLIQDPATGSFTNRVPFSEEGYSWAIFYDLPKIIPETDGEIPEFALWESSETPLTGIDPEDWHFRIIGDAPSADYYVMFQVTDVRQVVHSSKPLLIENEAKTGFSVTPGAVETPEVSVGISAFLNSDNPEAGLSLQFELASRAGNPLQINQVDQIILNDSLSIRSRSIFDELPPGETVTETIVLSGEDLRGLEDLICIDAVLELRHPGDYSAKGTVQIPLHLSLEDCDVSGISEKRPPVLAETEDNGTRWQLLSLCRNPDLSVSGLLYGINDTDEILSTGGTIYLNGVESASISGLYIQPHTGGYLSFTAPNNLTLTMLDDLNVKSRKNMVLMEISDLLGLFGIREIDRLDYCRGSTYKVLSSEKPPIVSFTLPEPFPLETAAEEAPETVSLLTGELSAELVGVFVADDGIAAALLVRNDSDEPVEAMTVNIGINGKAAGDSTANSLLLPAHTGHARFIILKGTALRPNIQIRETSFSIWFGVNLCAEIRIQFPEGVFPGADGGTWIEANRLKVTVSAPEPASEPPAEPSVLSPGESIPFGTYPQAGEGTDRTPIEWLVLDVQGNKALVISRYGLDAKPYNTGNSDVTWETCTLRGWLNGEFLNRAFSPEEQSAILTTAVDNSLTQGYIGYSSYTSDGNDTQDKIFLLSYAEAYKYFGVKYWEEDAAKNMASRAAPTAYAVKDGAMPGRSARTAEGSEAVTWWLRSPGPFQSNAAVVNDDGSLIYYSVNIEFICVRPAFWLNTESLGTVPVDSPPLAPPNPGSWAFPHGAIETPAPAR